MASNTREVYWDGELGFIDQTPEQVKELMAQKRDNIWDLPPFSFCIVAATFSDNEGALAAYGGNEDGTTADYMDGKCCGLWLDLLCSYYQMGYKLFTMNGTFFDWKLLANNGADWEMCVELSLKSYDPAFQMRCQYGFPVGLNPCARAMGLPVKEMPGVGAPLAWMLGEHDAVEEYVIGDCRRLAGVVANIKQNHGIHWLTRKGGLAYRPLEKGMMTVEQCVKYYLRRDLPIVGQGVWWADALELGDKK